MCEELWAVKPLVNEIGRQRLPLTNDAGYAALSPPPLTPHPMPPYMHKAGQTYAYSLAIYHVLTHACFTALLFLGAGV
jgi:hypothetical protein